MADVKKKQERAEKYKNINVDSAAKSCLKAGLKLNCLNFKINLKGELGEKGY